MISSSQPDKHIIMPKAVIEILVSEPPVVEILLNSTNTTDLYNLTYESITYEEIE